LFVGNLSYDATEAELRELFAGVGQPTRIMVPVDRDTGRPRGFAFVEFPERAVAEEAIRRFNSQVFKGRPLAVSEARPREEGGPRPGGMGPRPGPGAGGFAPRPAPGGFGGPPRPFRPLDGGGPPAPGASRERNFGPPAPPKGKRGGPAKRQQYKERGPKGPIRERVTGRFYAVDDEDDVVTPGAEDIGFENFATSQAEGETDSDDRERDDES
jgi:RNA recognition motif-containing protein